MACANINELLEKESGRIAHDIYRRTFATSPWLHLVDQSTWPAGMGDIINQLIYDRTLPQTSPLTWNPIATGSDTCLPSKYIVEFGQTLIPFQLSRMAIESDKFCVDKLRTAFDVDSQLSQIIKILADNTAWAWKERLRSEYTRLSANNVVATAGLPSGTTMPLVAPTLVINQGILDKFYYQLTAEGAQNENPFGFQDGAPVFALVLSPEANNLLLRADENFRQDVRWAYAGKETDAPLMKSIGATFARRGYVHMIDTLAPRWEFTAGAWVRVPEYVSVATTNGNSLELNPAYLSASYEDITIFHRGVYKSLVPVPERFKALRFDPITYRGDFRWENFKTYDDGTGTYCNPDGTIGFFRGVFAQASQSMFPQYGYVIRYKRCNAEAQGLTCVYST